MGHAAKSTRQNRTITVDFQDPSTYFQLINDRKAFVESLNFSHFVARKI